MLPMENAAQMNAYIHARSNQTAPTVPHAICPNETVGADIHAQFSQAKCVGAVPVCPPERPRSGVSILKIHALCAGDERWMRPGGATRAGTQAPPLLISIIFSHTSHTNKITIYTQSTQTKSTIPRAICPNETVGAVPACPPERPRSGVSIPKTHAWCAGNLTMDAPLWGDTGGHTGTAPTHLHHIFPHNSTQTK